MKLGAILGLIVLVPSSEFRVPSAGGYSELGTRYSELHDTHVSHTRMVLEGNTVACRVRLFKDDLEKALRAETHRPELRITAEDRSDSAFARYYARSVTLSADGRPVTLRVTGSGTEKDEAAQEVVWYLLEGGLAGPVRQLTVLNGLLFDYFRDQQNILLLLRLPEDQRQTLYFVASDPREQKLSF